MGTEVLHVILCLLCSVLYAAIAEYVAHRWFMHMPIPTRTKVYENHAVEHHGKGRNDINISMDPIAVAILGSPVFLPILIVGWWWGIFTVIMLVLYQQSWTKLHHAHHNLKYRWVKRIPGYYLMRCHHLLHHDHPNKNFGAVFIFSDYLFGTKLNV
jgi:sterol desaturase/sphingolipid hydroxylase (fatty acid hydroxylase superfamily)